MALIGIEGYAIPHGSKNGEGGTTIIYNNTGGNVPSDLNVTTINASKGNIKLLTGTSMSYDDASIDYLSGEEARLNKISGQDLNYNNGNIGNLSSTGINTNTLDTQEMNAIKAWVQSLMSENITTDYLTVTKQAHFFELIIDKVKSVGGTLLITATNCIADYVKALKTVSGSLEETTLDDVDAEYYDVYWLATGTDGRENNNEWEVNDQAYCQSFNVKAGTSYDTTNKYYWRLVTEKLQDTIMNLSNGETIEQTPMEDPDYNSLYIYLPRLYWNDNDYTDDSWEVSVTDDGRVYWEQVALQSNKFCGIMGTTDTVNGIVLTPAANSDLVNTIPTKLSFYCYKPNTQHRPPRFTPARLNVTVTYINGAIEVFTAPETPSPQYDITLSVGLPIANVVITNADEVSWKTVHGIRLSNVSGQYDETAVTGTASIPSIGDNICQLGYRGIDYPTRSNAIIIASSYTPDQGYGVAGDSNYVPPVVAPSYAQYEGITDFNLYSHRKTYMDSNGAKFVGDITLCSINGSNIEQVIEDATEDLDSIKLMPKEEQLEAKILSSITAQNHRVNLKCKLVYDVRYKHGDTIENIDLTQQSSSNIYYKIRFFVTYVNGTPSSTYYEFTNMQHLYSNSYEAANLLDVINVSNNSDAYRDYMKCYNDHPDCCPLYLTVELVKVDPTLQTPTETVIDQRVVNVGLENGALFSVTDNRISSQVASSLNNYYTKSEIDQTAENITSSVTTGYTQTYMNGYSKVIDLTSVAPHCFVPVGISFKYDEDNHEIGDSKGGFRAEGYNISIDRNFSADYGAPDYSTHTNGSSVADGFVFGCSWHTVASGYGTNWGDTQDQDAQGWYAIEKNGTNLDTYRFITGNDCTWTQDVTYVPNDSSTKIPANYICGSIRQNHRTSEELIYLRGGSKYNVRTDCLLNCRIQAYTGIDGYVDNTGGRTVRMPMLNLNYTGWNTLIVPVKDQMKRSEIVQTADSIALSVTRGLQSTGIDITSGNINLQADKVTFSSGSQGTQGYQSGKIWIDNNSATLHTENADINGKITATSGQITGKMEVKETSGQQGVIYITPKEYQSQEPGSGIDTAVISGKYASGNNVYGEFALLTSTEGAELMMEKDGWYASYKPELISIRGTRTYNGYTKNGLIIIGINSESLPNGGTYARLSFTGNTNNGTCLPVRTSGEAWGINGRGNIQVGDLYVLNDGNGDSGQLRIRLR